MYEGKVALTKKKECLLLFFESKGTIGAFFFFSLSSDCQVCSLLFLTMASIDNKENTCPTLTPLPPMYQRVPTPPPNGDGDIGTSFLLGTIIPPTGVNNWKDLEQGTGVANLNEVMEQEHPTFKELCAGITPPLLPPPGLEFMAGLLPSCEVNI